MISCGSTVLLVADRADVEDYYAQDEAGTQTDLVPEGAADRLIGINLLADGDFASGENPWRPVMENQARSGVDLAPDWTLAGAHTGYSRLAPGVASATVLYHHPVYGPTIPVLGGRDYMLSAYVAAHRVAVFLQVTYFGADGNKVGTFSEKVEDIRSGGAKLANYSFAFLNTTAPESARTASVSFRMAADDMDGGEDGYLFHAYTSFFMSSGKPARGWHDTVPGILEIIKALGTSGTVLLSLENSPWRGDDSAKLLDIYKAGTRIAEGVRVERLPLTCPWMIIRGRRFSAGVEHEAGENLVKLLGDAGKPSVLGVQVMIDGMLDTIGFAHKTQSPERREV